MMSFDTPSNPDWVNHAYVGMKVVCVSKGGTVLDTFGNGSSMDASLTVDEIYTIKEITEFPFPHMGICLWLGQYNRKRGKHYHASYLFKPLRTTKQGMETLTSILKSPEREIQDA